MTKMIAADIGLGEPVWPIEVHPEVGFHISSIRYYDHFTNGWMDWNPYQPDGKWVHSVNHC